MATSALSNTILTPGGGAVAGARVVARLLPFPGFKESDGTEIASQVETSTDSNGDWSLTLERNADITPDNTFYEITEYVPSGGRTSRRVWAVSVPSSSISLLDALISPPTAHPPYTITSSGAVGEHTHDESDVTSLVADLAAKATTAALAAHEADTTSIHGITDTSALETTTGSASKVATHSADTTDVHGIADTSALATAADITTHSNDTTSVHGITDTSALETTTGSADKVATHSADTTSVHGITDTSVLVTTAQLTAITANTQTDSYTLVLGDAGKVIEMNKGTANDLTVPPNGDVAFPTGTCIEIFQYGAGQTTVVAGSGVTIVSSGGDLKLTGQYSGASLRKRGTNEWTLVGDITA